MADPRILAASTKGRRTRARGGLLGRSLTVFPVLVLPIGLYILIAIFSGSSADPAIPGVQGALDARLFQISMLSGASWQFRLGDLVLLFALLALAIEIVKSTSTKSGAIINHAVSMGLLVFCLIGFLVFSSFATSVFFMMTMMCLLDVLVGAMVTIVSARRDFGVGDGFGG